MSDVSPKISRLTHVLLSLLVIGVWGLLLLLWFSRTPSAAHGSADKRFDVITAERINIVDADGKPRLVISDPARFPDAVVRGKSYKRSIRDNAGVLFYDVDGTETGGLITATAAWGRYAALIFDYTNPPTDGVGIFRIESVDGKTYSAGLSVADRRPNALAESENSQGIQRAKLETKDGDAELIISDTEGKPRILLGVDRANTPRLEIRDAEGNVQHRYPPQ
ncbi:MAG: hypothetical protein DME55_00610 [Verrucomicrobia bacterium]|nr:MAG: hypothetical protein DME55_00610 [Verrucomicrobiota bacterium]